MAGGTVHGGSKDAERGRRAAFTRAGPPPCQGQLADGAREGCPLGRCEHSHLGPRQPPGAAPPPRVLRGQSWQRQDPPPAPRPGPVCSSPAAPPAERTSVPGPAGTAPSPPHAVPFLQRESAQRTDSTQMLPAPWPERPAALPRRWRCLNHASGQQCYPQGALVRHLQRELWTGQALGTCDVRLLKTLTAPTPALQGSERSGDATPRKVPVAVSPGAVPPAASGTHGAGACQ